MCPTFSFMRFVSLGGAGLPVPYFHDITEATQENFCMRYKSRSRALVGAAAAGLLGLAGLTMAASPAQATEDTAVTRVAGETRYSTAADAATSAYATGSANVVLASGQVFPDALAAAGVAGTLDAPILLTQQDNVPDATLDALDDLGATDITIMGGTAAVSQDVEDALVALGYTTTRVEGADRFATAAEAAEVAGGTTAVLADGFEFADALAISPGAHALDLPLLLTPTDTLSPDAAGYITANSVDTVIIVGGTAAVSQGIQDDLEADGITVNRLAGINRYETSVAIADFHVTQGFTLDELVVATGENFADALAGGPYASVMGAPLVLTQTSVLTPATATYITDNCQAIDALSILGGTAAVTTAVEDAAAAAAQCEITSNQSFAVTPSDEAANFVSTTLVGNQGRRAYEVTGLDTTADYDIALFPAENVSIDDEGNVTFTSNATIADNTGPSIEVVNGSAQTVSGSADETEQVNNVSPQTDGTITFAIDSDVLDEVVPVIWLDAEVAGDNMLDLNADGTPSEDFGIGGQKNWIPAEATATDIGGTVTSANQNLDYFVAGSDTYFYDDNDAFALNAAPITMAQFEGLLTINDVITVTYDPDAADQSVFNVTLDVVPPATNVTATATDADADGTADDVVVNWMASTQADAVYDVARSVDADCATAGDNTQIADNISATTVTDLNVSATTTTRTYCVTAVGGTSGTASGTTNSATVTVPPAPDTTEPETVLNGAAVDSDNGSDGIANTGDVWVLVFDEGVTLTSDASISVTDGVDSTIVERGVNSTWEVDGQKVTVTLAAPLAGPGPLNYPLTMNFGAGVQDAAGNDWVDSGGGVDLALETDGPEFMVGGSTSVVVSATQLVLEFNEPLTAVTVSCGDFTITTGACTSVAVSTDGLTVTMTGTGFVGGTTTVAIAGSILDTEGQETTTQAAQTIPAA